MCCVGLGSATCWSIMLGGTKLYLFPAAVCSHEESGFSKAVDKPYVDKHRWVPSPSPAPSLFRSHQLCPRDADLCPRHSPVKGTAPGSRGLSCEILWVTSILRCRLVGFFITSILHWVEQGNQESPVIGSKNKPWSWAGGTWDKAGPLDAQAAAEAFATQGAWMSCRGAFMLRVVKVISAPSPLIKWISREKSIFLAQG